MIFRLVVIAAVVNFRRSDRRKLAPSARNYDRVILPSTSSAQSQQESGAGKIRPGRRGNRLPSNEVFALGVQSPPAAEADINLSPNGSVDEATPPVLASSTTALTSDTDNGGRGGRKQSSKKDDKTNNAARCLRGRPPGLQKPYFIADDDGAEASGGGKKNAANDPFWDPSEAPTAPRRQSIEEAQATSLFKPSRSLENLASTSGSTSNIQPSFVLLPSGDIGSTSTDN